MPRLSLFALLPLSFAVSLLAGCSANFDPLSGASSTGAMSSGNGITGSVHGGRQAIVGAKVFLLQNGVTADDGTPSHTGNGGPGLEPSPFNRSVSLLSGAGTTTDTTAGSTYNLNYVLTSATGGFALTGLYTCTPGRQVYIFAYGGKPDGETDNTAAANMAALGACPGTGVLPSSLRVYMNEVSTVAMAYAVAGYASDATHVSNNGTSLSITGMNNAFANAAQLYDISDANNGTGAASARTLTPNGQGTVPAALLNSMANTLAACVNSSGPGSPQCSTLFAHSSTFGDSGATVVDTASAMINIAHNPSNAVATLYELPSATGYPFAPNLGTSTPTDFTVAISYAPLLSTANPGVQPPVIDANGNMWFTDGDTTVNSAGSVVRYSPLGDVTVFTNQVSTPRSLATSVSNETWVANQGVSGSSYLEINPDQATPTVFASQFSDPQFIVFDHYGQAWVNQESNPVLTIYDASKTAINPAPVTLDDLAIWVYPQADHSGNINAIAYDSNFNAALSRVSYSGSALHQSVTALDNNGYTFTLGSAFLADSSDNLWIYATADADPNVSGSQASVVLQKYNSTLSTGPTTYAGPTIFNVANGTPQVPFIPAIDGAGTFWAANGSALAAQSASGTVISPANTSLSTIEGPFATAVDGSGNVWVMGYHSTGEPYIAELIGVATPAITPISPNNPANSSLTGLGVRP